MIDSVLSSLLEATALPNLHPALVHFPVVLFPLAIGFDLAGLGLRRQSWWPSVATLLFCGSASSAWLALWAGERAADALVGVPAAVQPRIAEHSDWAHYAVYAVTAIAAVRTAIHFHSKLKVHSGARIAVTLLALGGLAVLVKTADLGGSLVYQHAVGVDLPQTASVAVVPVLDGATTDPQNPEQHREHANTGSPLERLLHTPDGALQWTPNPGDRLALEQVITAPPGTDLAAVRWAESTGPDGMTVRVNGTATLLLPGIFGDVQVEASLELLDFKGFVGVVHHVTDSQGGNFSVANDGAAVLSDLREGNHQVLDKQQASLPEGRFTLGVSSAGRHLKGLLDGVTITHGHIPAGAPGGSGLLLDGAGSLRIHSLLVTPLENR